MVNRHSSEDVAPVRETTSTSRLINESSINLTHGGLQRHRVLWLREMSEEGIRQVGETGPTIDSIEVAEFESHDALKQWLSKKASAFASKTAEG
jgi:hypothetical protein